MDPGERPPKLIEQLRAEVEQAVATALPEVHAFRIPRRNFVLGRWMRYGGNYPESLVYIGACRSTFNNTMANAFLGKGARTYLGFSQYVDGPFAANVATTFFHRPGDWVLHAGALRATSAKQIHAGLRPYVECGD